MAKNTPAFQFYPSDFLGGVMLMDMDERGAYITLLCVLWVQGNCIKESTLWRAAGCTKDEFDRIWPAIKDKFEIENGIVSHPRFAKDIASRKAKAANGRAGGKRNKNARDPGQIYFALREDGQVKIGLSRDAKKRISGLKSKHGHLETLQIMDVSDMSSAEKIAHAHAIEYRTKGEWFDIPNEKITSVISGIESKLSGQAETKRSGQPDLKNEERRMKDEDLEKEDWIVPDRLDTPDVRSELAEFAAMRRRIGKPIKSLKNSSRGLKNFDDPDHLLYAIEFCIANEYQGLKPEYRPQKSTKSVGERSMRERL